ncbi:MAG: hypothetical protein M0004_06415 [Actinomycetota bacterium]|nr:hypothetical protein [Actinomycetota bacterium]
MSDPHQPGGDGAPGLDVAPPRDEDHAASTPGGRFEDGAPSLPPRQAMPKRGPALVVVGIVALISLGGAAMALAGTHSSPKKRPALPVGGRGSLRAERATAILAPIERGGEPPRDVLDRLVVPKGSVRTSVQCAKSVIDLYDCAVHLTAPGAPPAVLSFFEHELPRLGWAKLSIGPTDHGLGTEVLDQVASNDGYYWEVGAFVDPLSSPTPGVTGAASAVVLRVAERGDGG